MRSWFLALAVACSKTEVGDDGVEVPGDSDSDADTDADTDSDADSDSDTDADADTDTDTDTATIPTDRPFVLADPLVNGTVGLAVGGAFGADGWTVTAPTDRIVYELPRLVEGSVEFTMGNVTLGNLVVNDNEIFGLYEGGFGMVEPVDYNPEFRDNHYKIEIRVYGQAEVGREGQQKLMWGMCPSGDPGYGECGCTSFFEEPYGGDGSWDGTPQRIRVEWGGGITRYLRNGAEVLVIDWSASGLEFGPSALHFSLGTPRPNDVGTASMPIGAVFSNVLVEGVEGDEAACP